jgi:hypothetical protein
MVIEVKANDQTILREDLWSLLFLGILKEGVCRLNPEADVKVFADGREIEKPWWWDYDEEADG